MKFLKKLALATASGAIPPSHCTDPEFIGAFFSCCLHSFTNLLHTGKKKLDCPDPQATNPRTASNTSTSVIDWAPLIKATFSPEADSQNGTRYRLSGRSVLCVGGRIKLYPEYNRLIKNCDGCFMAFHGSSRDNLEDLPRFLKQADMILCPVDCVNHEAFFTVRHYCKYSGKPCVLLERSEIKHFKAGIRKLAEMVVSR